MAHRHTACVLWQGSGEDDFRSLRYSRAHLWRFDGGIEVPASSSPSVVPLPMSDAQAVDPEEAFVASLSSCHMLWFLDIAARAGYAVRSYRDDAEGLMGRNGDGKIAIVRVRLAPEVAFDGAKRPDDREHEALHHRAHAACFIANSVLTEIVCEPQIASL